MKRSGLGRWLWAGLALSQVVPTSSGQADEWGAASRSLPVPIAENRGQYAGPATYVARVGGMTAHLLPDRIALRLVGVTAQARQALRAQRESGEPLDADLPLPGANVHLEFVGANAAVQPVAIDPLPTKLSWFRGNDPDQWVAGVPCWGSVVYEEMWPGIDVRVRGDSGRLEYDLIVRAGADLSRAELAVRGADALHLDDDGSLVIETAAGAIVQPAPTTWVEHADGSRTPLVCTYKLRGSDRFSFAAPTWTGDAKLVVDPKILFGTYLGGSVIDQATVIEVEASGHVLLGGTMFLSTDFPTTPGSFDTTLGGSSDAFFSRLSPDMSQLLGSAYVGGSAASEYVRAILPRASGDIVLQGYTASSDFPITPGAYQEGFAGEHDVFVMSLSNDATTIHFSTYLGGSDKELADGACLDELGRIFVVGSTQSEDFPSTPDAEEPVMLSQCLFISRLSADGSALEYSSFALLGMAPSSMSIARSPSGHIAVAGRTSVKTLPVTRDGFGPVPGAFVDGFVLSFDPDLHMEWCGYLRGELDEFPYGIAIGPDDCVYVTGTTSSGSFPTTPGASDTFKSGSWDAFVTRIAADGSSLIYSTFLGGSQGEKGFGIAIDEFGCAVVAGESGSTNLFTAPDALPYIPTSFVARLSPDGSHLWTGTLLGQPGGTNDAYEVALGPDGAAYVAGFTWSDLLPGTGNAYDDTLDGNSDAYVLKVDLAMWTDLGSSLAPTAGPAPQLVGDGELLAGGPVVLRLTQASAFSTVFLLLAIDAWNLPFKGGVIVPAVDPPLGLMLPLATNGSGALLLPATWAPGFPHGVPIYAQCWMPDPAGPAGFTASNAVVAVTVE